MISETRVQSGNAFLVGIADENLDALLSKPNRQLRQPLLIRPRKQLAVVFVKAVVLMSGDIGRIKIDKIPKPRLLGLRLKIPCEQPSFLEQFRRGADAVLVADGWLLISPEWCIEFALPGYSIKAVPTGSIEVKEPRGNGVIGPRPLGAEFV